MVVQDAEKLAKLREVLIKKTRAYSESFPKYSGESYKSREDNYLGQTGQIRMEVNAVSNQVQNTPISTLLIILLQTCQ